MRVTVLECLTDSYSMYESKMILTAIE